MCSWYFIDCDKYWQLYKVIKFIHSYQKLYITIELNVNIVHIHTYVYNINIRGPKQSLNHLAQNAFQTENFQVAERSTKIYDIIFDYFSVLIVFTITFIQEQCFIIS